MEFVIGEDALKCPLFDFRSKQYTCLQKVMLHARQKNCSRERYDLQVVPNKLCSVYVAALLEPFFSLFLRICKGQGFNSKSEILLNQSNEW